MADLYKVLHIYDTIVCDNGGVAELIRFVKERRDEIQDDLKIVTDDDLLRRVKIFRCSKGCKKIVSISQGKAKDVVESGDAVPILSNLQATSDKGCNVKADSSLAAQLTLAEKRAKKVYIDTQNHPTVGIGFNLDKSTARAQLAKQGLDYDKVLDGSQTLTDQQIDALFAEDQKTAEDQVRKEITNFDTLSPTQQKALTDMVFNMGSFVKFPKFVQKMNAGDFAGAAKEAGLSADGKSSSLWVQQVGDRAKRIIAQIKGDEVYATPE